MRNCREMIATVWKLSVVKSRSCLRLRSNPMNFRWYVCIHSKEIYLVYICNSTETLRTARGQVRFSSVGEALSTRRADTSSVPPAKGNRIASLTLHGYVRLHQRKCRTTGIKVSDALSRSCTSLDPLQFSFSVMHRIFNGLISSVDLERIEILFAILHSELCQWRQKFLSKLQNM